LANKLTRRQEAFATLIFQGMTQRKAWVEAGYSPNYPIEVLDVKASVLANSPKIKERLNQLREKLDDELVAPLIERKRIATEVARADMRQPITAREKVLAISELNKMEHIYDEKPQFQDNRVYNILVQGDEAKDRFNKLLEGRMPQDVVVDAENTQDVGAKND